MSKSKLSVFLSTLLLAALLLAACGGEETQAPGTVPPVTSEATATEALATESPTEVGTATDTAGVPVTGETNPARLSNQLDFTVWSQDGEQVGEVDDMVLDLENSQVAYVVVGTGGFLDLGEKDVLVPWDMLELQTGTGDTTGGQQNAFVLQTDVDTFSNAPDFDLGSLPERGQPANDWDVDLRTYWESGGTAGGTANTPAANATATADLGVQATATTGTELATAPATTDQGTGQALQGVVLATEVLGSTINWGAQGQGTGTGLGTDQGQATPTPDVSAGAGTAAPGATAEATATTGTGSTDLGTNQGNTTGTIEDMIVDIDTGDILYIVVVATFDDGEHWIPVPLNLFQWNGAAGAFTLNVDASTLQNAPSFQDGQFPDTMTSGWNSEFDTFWQNNGGTGGTGTTDTVATATP